MVKLKIKNLALSSNGNEAPTKAANGNRKLKVKIKAPPSSSSSGTSAPTTVKGNKTRTIKLNPTKKNKTIRFKLNADGSSKGKKVSKSPKIKMVPRIPLIKLKVFGDGYDSEAPDKEDEPLLEEGIILRLMKDAELDYVRHSVESGDLSGISIRWKDSRRAAVIINSSYYLAKLVDLPTILESHKSVDKKNIFKTIDVCQMLYVFKKITNEEYEIFFNTLEESEDNNDSNKERSNGEHQEVLRLINEAFNSVTDSHPDGLTPPMNNVRKNRFAPMLNVKHIEKIENKVEELLRLDEEAESVQLDLMNESDYNNFTAGFTGFGHTPTASFSQPAANTPNTNLDNMMTPQIMEEDEEEEVGEQRIRELGEEDAEEDDEEGEEVDIEVEGDGEIDDKDIEKMLNDYEVEEDDEEREGGAGAGATNQIEIEQASDEDEDEDDEDDEDEDEDEEDEDEDDDEDEDADESSKQHNKILKEEIQELETTIKDKEKKLKDIHNEILKNRVLGAISKLKHELEVKKRQLKNDEKEKKKEQNETEAKRNKNNQEDEDGDDEDDEDDDEDEDDEMEEYDEEEDAPGAGNAKADITNNDDDDDAFLEDLF